MLQCVLQVCPERAELVLAGGGFPEAFPQAGEELGANIPACSAVPRHQQLSDLLQSEPQVLRGPDERQAIDGTVVVVPVVA